MRSIARVGMAGLVTVGILAAAPTVGSMPAFASGGGGVQVTGTCSGSSLSTLSVKPDNGQLEVEFQVDENIAGQTWSVRLSDNGTVFFTGKRVTQAPSGSFTVRKLTADQPGTDTIKAKARNASTGEVCTATASI